jgi:hypothetical protein
MSGHQQDSRLTEEPQGPARNGFRTLSKCRLLSCAGGGDLPPSGLLW